MKTINKAYITLGLAGLLALASCKVTQTYKRPDNLKAGSLYRDSSGADTTTMASLPWRTLFADTILQGLIQEGINNNLDLKTAVLKIAESAATLQSSKMAYLPSLDVSLQATKAKSSQAALNFPAGIGINLNTVTYQASLNASWEVNVWGQLSSLKRQALANFLQSDAAKRAVQTQLIADIANNYYNLLSYDQQLQITEETVKNRIKDVATMKDLKEGAIVNGAAVVQSEANRYAAEVSIPDLKQSIRETENALCILLARAPGPIKRATLAGQVPVTQLSTGLSAQLLSNRPDVQESEYAFRSAFENTNVAHSYFYPTFSITASGGLSSLQLKNFFNNSVFYNLVGGLTQPIFNKGQNKARYRIAQAQQLEAFNTFQQKLLTAGQEVSNALYAYQTAVAKHDLRAKQIAALEKSVSYTNELLRYNSSTNYTDVLTSEQSLLAAQLSGVSDRLQQLQAAVNLYKALGGGWR
ncbi:efflux transporter outer membrane subunit [Mucilaginibacter phyllosphaerae]|uniref:Efflux transporter outer membrane subunit n=1 Tax=Mucilaginibacter phyllosphaerae TaxID=1812349 RepID=A0A4Y8AH77_9SPHI|nr:efflux transporter outer membrane subunit [Mucilaginibacter phyllosphaerae]MBB3968712.1 NodT family efflux transporter outer membrane factor (OMF) lipoprotein [Mucilaginibacter phyllosphaerae]TEW67652.1 efflux transporter outer membrane subunit [Mucilaginibacter phyllosphaerae]GGH14342.1 multidrug transporter [Mucilaginibacter phyllosphaerae]